MPATWIMPAKPATWRHCATASDSIQLAGEANTVTVADSVKAQVAQLEHTLPPGTAWVNYVQPVDGVQDLARL